MGEGAGGGIPNYIEEVFSTYLYTGNAATRTITNGIDLSTYGGLVWFKNRTAGTENALTNTVSGTGKYLISEQTVGTQTLAAILTAFNSTGFSIGNNTTNNENTASIVSWTFRKQPKFFDIQTWTGNATNRTIAHSLGVVPGCIIVKRTDTTAAWAVYHSSLANTQYLVLNTTAAAATGATRWNSTTPTSAVFSLGTDASVNASGGTYVAYIYAHDAGGFGLAGTDNVVSCGSFTSTTAGATITLGYEPQFLIMKPSSDTGDWVIVDNMRGFNVTTDRSLYANAADVEIAYDWANPTSTGFIEKNNNNGVTYIYIAIRRGPMKVPTTGTSVFGLSARAGTGANATVTGGQTDDAVLVKNSGAAVASLFSSRLTGTGYVTTTDGSSNTPAEVAAGVTILQANPWDVMDGVKVGTTSTITNASANTYVNYLFKRAPSFMDIVCYTGTGTAGQTYTHNLGVVPELMLVKCRSNAVFWAVYVASSGATQYARLNDNSAFGANVSFWNDTAPTASVFSVGTSGAVNVSARTYIAYLFATCAGVSKVGSYTGNGSTQTINCGLTAGARFVLIKRTDATGSWYVYDTARGMTVLTDPYWLTDETAAEVATLGSVTTVATGFAVDSAILAAINTSSATFIFLAIA